MLASSGAWAVEADVLADYVALQAGRFTSEAQARQEAGYQSVTWYVVEIWSDDDPAERWLYTESRADAATSPYMQRITRLSSGSDGTITGTRYTLPDPARYAGAWHDTARFSSLSPAELKVLPGCDLTITRTGAGRFESTTAGDRCRNSYKGASYAVSQSTITADGMENWDRGFDAAGNLVWGPPAGPYRLRRVAD